MTDSTSKTPLYGKIENERCPESPTSIPHDAILIDLISAGMLETVDFNGRKKSAYHIVWVWQVFPVDGSRQANGQPFYLSRDATTSLFPGGGDYSPSVSYMVVTGMKPTPFANPNEAARFDLNTLVGKPCRLNVYHKNGFPQLATDTDPGKRGVEPFTDTDGKFIADQKLWPQAELDYYTPEGVDEITKRLTNPDRFKKKEETAQAPTSQAQINQGSGRSDDDSTIPF